MSDSFRHIWTITKRELSGYFASPIAYVFIVIFLVMTGFFTFTYRLGSFFEAGQASLNSFFHWHPWLYLFLVPAVGMRLWAEERRLGTMELLLTMPITTWQAIVAKFLASWLFLIIALALTFPIVFTVSYLGDPDDGTIITGYIGSALLAGAYLAVTCLTSAMTRNQVISFILSVVICFFLVLAGWELVTDWLVSWAPAAVVSVVRAIGVMTHFQGFEKGVIDMRDLVYFLSVIGFSLFCNGVVIRNLAAAEPYERIFQSFNLTEMKSKKVETLLYSAIGVAVMFAVIVAINLIAGAARARLDTTADKLYTLSDGTKAILKRVDTPVEIRFYFSQSETRVPSEIRTYASQVEDLLEEFREASGGKIRIRKIDPKPDTDAEETAQADGIEPQPTGPPSQENFYFGLVISLDPEKAAIPFLQPQRERLLEYDLARAIGGVISTSKPVVGIMTALPMFGQPMNPMMMRMGQQQGQRPWVFISELKRDYTVKQLQMDVDKIDDDVQILIVAHPKDISDKAQYAIDQFVLRGGKLLALFDSMCVIDRPQQPNNPMAGMLPGGGSSLPKLLQAWGVAFDSTKVVADANFTRELAFQQGQRPQPMPTWLFVNQDGINNQDVVTAQIDNLLLPAPGAFSGTPATGIQQTVLLHTTKKSQLVDGMTAQFSGQKTLDDFKGSGTEYPLAVRLKGKFKTAFPDGKPAAVEEKPDEKEKPEAEKKKEEPGTSLKESKTDGVVILMGDTDFIYDNFCVQVNPLFGVASPINGNLGLAQNMVEQLSGDVSLVGTRSRGALRRPFTVVQRMQAEAEEQYRDRIRRLNEDLQTAQTQLNEMQSKKEPGQKLILSPEQQSKIAEFQKKQRDTQRELRDLRKNLRQDVESMESRLKWTNIAGMPALVILTGLSVFFVRKQRTKAR